MLPGLDTTTGQNITFMSTNMAKTTTNKTEKLFITEA